jgi:hypothetical protein
MVFAKRALKPQQVQAIRFWLDREWRLRDRAMFDLAIDSKLRGCEVVKVRIGYLVNGGQIRSRAIVAQQETGRPVQFVLLEPARDSVLVWLERPGGTIDEFAFPSRIETSRHATSAARRCCSAAQKSRVPFGTWAPTLGMRSRSLKARRYNIS